MEIIMSNYFAPEEDGLIMRPSGAWAEQKLDYLARYIDVFETSMKGKWPSRNYIDLMAGPGKNRVRGSNKIFLGSPLLSLTTRYPFTGYFFVDLDSNNVDALKTRCDASPNGQRVNIYNGDCNVLVDNVVARLRQNERSSLNLAFLDPEGFELHWATVAKLASVGRMDLIINYPQGGLNRLIRLEYESKGQSILDSFFGDREWRKLYESWMTKATKVGLHRSLIDHYKGKLRNLGYTQVFAGSDVVEDEPLMRNTRSAPLYRLLFASKHNRGYEFWLKVIRRDVHGSTRLPGF
jgi:three-Cys-motif partner protein